jgi:UPF0755 protein
MNDILPPQKRPQAPPNQPVNRPMTPPTAPQQPVALPPVQPPLEPQNASAGLKTSKKSKKKLILWILGGIITILLLLGIGGAWWYNTSLTPVNKDNKERIRVEITAGSSPADISQSLKQKNLIRSEFAFDIYTRLSGARSSLQAGTYSLSPSESTPDIVKHLTSGKTDEFNLTFFPGGTLTDPSDKPLKEKTDVTSVLLRAGYEESEIKAALSKTYNHPLFTDKPAGTTLEGYIYGETYSFSSGASVEEILERTFDEMYKQIQQNNLIEGFKAQGLNLYQGITLASIIQREVSSQGDQKQVAQVFFKRLAEGMPLGADSTFIYGAQLLGTTPSVNLDSPYNTRIHTGLPPGPISSPGLTSLIAVANPAPGDYLYFVSGDDGKNYFSRTLEEHEANTQQHCHANCSLF